MRIFLRSNSLILPTVLFRRNKQLIQELSTPTLDSKDLYFSSRYSQPFFAQCITCLWKQHLSYWRNTSYTAVRLLFTTIIALMFGVIFWDIGSKRCVKNKKKNKTLLNHENGIIYILPPNAF